MRRPGNLWSNNSATVEHMKIPFWKMHGAGNDFILVDDRALTFPAKDTAWLTRIAARRTGIGGEGIILIQPSTHGDFRMRFFNPDGSEVDMCGNGARCVARLAIDIGAAPNRLAIETAAGIIRAERIGEQIKLQMTAPTDWRLRRRLLLSAGEHDYCFVNSGVPHVVLILPDLDRVNVKQIGAEVRYHKEFAPSGTNVNFIAVTGPHALRIRTYERGVEDETLACGTGMVAAGLVAGRLGLVNPPVQLTCASGDTLTVDYHLTADSADNVTLLGPAAHVFQGVLEH